MKQLLFLGDSITDCNHCFDPENLGFGYVRMISNELNKNENPHKFQLINKGNDGFTVRSVLRLWKSTAPMISPDFITILIGINDLAVIKNTGITEAAALAEFRQRYEELITEVQRNHDCPILLMEPFIFPHPAQYITWKSSLLKMNKIIHGISSSKHVDFLPLWSELLKAADIHGYHDITTDGIHLTETGHQILMEKWMEMYKKYAF